MEARQLTLDHLSASLISRVDALFVLLTPAVLWCHQSSCLLSVAGLSRLLLSNSGTVCLTASFLSTRLRPSGVISNIICSRSPTRTLFCDFCTVTPLVVLAVVSYLGHSKKILIDDVSMTGIHLIENKILQCLKKRNSVCIGDTANEHRQAGNIYLYIHLPIQYHSVN